MLLLLLVITTLAMMTKFKLLKTTTKTRTTGMKDYHSVIDGA